MKAQMARIAFLLSLVTVWVVLVASTLAATGGLFEATRKTRGRATPAWEAAPRAQADGGTLVLGRPD